MGYQPTFYSTVRAICLGGLCLFLAACGSTESDEIEYVERPPEQIYNEAAAFLDEGDYLDAARQFDEVERQHPYSRWATRAQIMAGYAYYQALDYEQAILTLDRFIGLNPGNEDVDYAYYLRALSYYERIVDVKRDQEMTESAMAALSDVVNRFPNTEYARDAALKYDLTRDHLAGKEMDIGRYYQRQGHLHAAVNRYRSVIETYQTTSHVPEALHRLTEVYLQLGIYPEAQATAAVLGHNFPGSDWYQDSYALLVNEGLQPRDPEDGWLSRAWNVMASAF